MAPISWRRPTIPEALFVAWHMTFAVIACVLIGDAVADRITSSATASRPKGCTA